MFLYKCGFICFIAIPAFAQNATNFHQSVSGSFIYQVNAGPNNNLFNNSPGYGVDYLFRPRRWLAFEAGLDQIIRPFSASICCKYGPDADDELFLVPFGVRYVWAPRTSRVRMTVGGGGAYMAHTIGNTGGGRFTDSRGGGGQFVASGDYSLTRSGRLRAGLTALLRRLAQVHGRIRASRLQSSRDGPSVYHWTPGYILLPLTVLPPPA